MQAGSGSSEKAWLDGVIARDEAALRALIAAHGRLVHGVARSVLTDPSLAEEVVQDTFLALWTKPGDFDPSRGSLRSYLCGVARNKAIDKVRSEQRQRRAAASVIEEMETSPLRNGPGMEERVWVLEALKEISAAQREAIALAYLGGRTYKEVATELGIPEGTAKTRLRDGLKALRERLGPATVTV